MLSSLLRCCVVLVFVLALMRAPLLAATPAAP
jgi:hypothetical protein